MYVSIYIYTYISICMYIHTYTYKVIYINSCVYVYIYVYTQICIYVYIYMDTYISIFFVSIRTPTLTRIFQLTICHTRTNKNTIVHKHM